MILKREVQFLCYVEVQYRCCGPHPVGPQVGVRRHARLLYPRQQWNRVHSAWVGHACPQAVRALGVAEEGRGKQHPDRQTAGREVQMGGVRLRNIFKYGKAFSTEAALCFSSSSCHEWFAWGYKCTQIPPEEIFMNSAPGEDLHDRKRIGCYQVRLQPCHHQCTEIK